MTAAHCPDDRLIHARAGSLSQRERLELEAHLAGCASCRALLQLGRDFDDVLGAREGDEEIGARITANLSPKRSPRARPLLVAGVLLGSVAAAAAMPGVRQAVSDVLFAGAERPALDVNHGAEPSIPPARRASSAPEEAPELPRAAAAEQVAAETVEAPAPTPARPSPIPSPQPGAAELFARANANRSNGDAAGARRTYAELQRRFPSSKEALVSHVSLGRLETNSDPAAAVRHFDAYLARAPRGALAEEALFGRATAQEAMGNSSAARATWQQLLQRFPSSIYAKRARSRVAAAP